MPARSHRLHHFVAVAVAVTTLAACGDDGPSPDAAAFCALVSERAADVVSPTIRTELDIETTIDLYRDLGDLAPLAIGEEWDQLTLGVVTAATVVPGDETTVQRAVQQAYATERAAVAVAAWVSASCGVDLGPVTTLAPQDAADPANPPGYSETGS